MHFAFIPYGIEKEIEHFKIDLMAQKFWFSLKKKGEQNKGIWLQGSLRKLPFGIWEYVFPKESLDMVLQTLCSKNEIKAYKIPSVILKTIRKVLRLKQIPKDWKKDKEFLWYRNHVSIIPLGIREDRELTETQGIYKGWTHEAI